jgi:hypothetical protein
MLIGSSNPAKQRRNLRFALFAIGEALLLATFVALARTPGLHGAAYYAELIALEIAAVILALATEHRRLTGLGKS